MDDNPVTDVSPNDFDPDIIAITHGHRDHTADAHRFDGVPVLGRPETRGYLNEKGYDETVAMNIGGTYTQDDVSFTMTNAFHSSGAPLETDYDYTVGTSTGYVIDDGETAFYHAGDAGLFGDMKTVICDIHAPDVAAIPIGGRHTMDPNSRGSVGADAAIPMHYNTFPVIEQDPQDFVDAVTDAEVFIPDVGESLEY